MAEPLMMEPPPAPDPNPNRCGESDPLPIPPLDPQFFSAVGPASTETVTPDLGFLLDVNSNSDFDFDFDFDLDGLDDFYLPSDTDPFLIPTTTQGQDGEFPLDAGISEISRDRASEDVRTYLKCVSSESGSCNREPEDGSGDRCSESDRTSNSPFPVSSQGSGNCGACVSEAIKASSPTSSNLGFGYKIDLKEMEKISVPKRKKENQDPNCESRSCKFSRLNANAAGTSGEEKRKVRLMRNRESAHLSRQRKKQYVEELEGKVKTMHYTISELNCRISYIMAENAALRHQLNGGFAFYPPPVIPSQWVPPNAVIPRGLVGIPKMKIEQPKSASKAKKSEKKSKTKKVASISFLGLLFFIFLFGGLFPFVNVQYGGISESFNGRSDYVGDRLYDQHGGRVLTVSRHFNGSTCTKFSYGNFDSSYRISRYGGLDHHALPRDREASAASNASEPLFASLYVPRNDKLVKIDGNLIIHSVLASEKAIASDKFHSETQNSRDTVSTIPREISSALAIPDNKRSNTMLQRIYGNPNELPKALSSGSADGRKLHQWFREGGTGPMLNSGMCTEVFQFDVASPGSIVHSSSMSNTSTNHHHHHHHHNATHVKKRKKNRRILQGLHVALTGSDNFNLTRDKMNKNSRNESFQGNKTGSSMVVSVLVDPREGIDAGIDGLMGPKPISRIFVVVLVDSVKHVTYSCILPRSGLHLASA